MAIWYDRADRGKFALGTKVEPGAPPQVRRLFALAEAKDPGRPADRAAGAPGRADPLDRLAKLNELRLAGALTEAEFEAQKAWILSTE